MALISLVSRLVNGVQRQVDLSVNTLVVQAIQINGTLLSATGGSALVGDAGGYTNFTPSAATVRGALQGIDSALTGSGSTQLDGTFKIENTTDITKILKFDASGITTGNTRTLKMADANVDLANLTNSNISASAAIVYSKLSLANSIVNADIASAAAIALSKLAALSTNLVLVSNGSGVISASAVTSTTLAFLDATSSVQTQLNSKLNLSGGTLTGALDMGSNKITSTYVPINPADLTNKTYVDNAIAGLTWKNAVRAASTANVSVASAPSTIDGVTLVSGDRVLLKNQTAGAENGIYVFSAAASPLVRSTDMDAWIEVVGAVMLSIEGSTNAGTKWVNTNVSGGTIGTTAITFTAFSVAGTVNGTGVAGQVAYWTGTATLTSEAFLAPVRGGTGVDGSAFTGIGHWSAGVYSASLIVNADVSGSAAIAYSKLALSNSIVNADISSSAAIAYSKLALTGSIVNADISASAAIVYSKLSLTNSIVAGDLTSVSVTNAKVNTNVFDQATITGGAGAAAVVQNAPALKRTLIAGQAFSANTSYAVRWGVVANGETSGRVYAADITTSSFDLFYVIGMASSATSVSAGQNILVTTMGSFTLSSSDTALGASNDGKAVFLTATGTFSLTAPSTSGQAITRIGVVQVASATNTSCIIDVFPAPIAVN